MDEVMIDVYDEMMLTVFIAAITGWPTTLPVTFRLKMMKMKSKFFGSKSLNHVSRKALKANLATKPFGTRCTY
jgi:hypothetical protein